VPQPHQIIFSTSRLSLSFFMTFLRGHGGESEGLSFSRFVFFTSPKGAKTNELRQEVGQEVVTEVGMTSRTPEPHFINANLNQPQLRPRLDIIS